MEFLVSHTVGRGFLLLNVVLAAGYFTCIALLFGSENIGNPVLFGLLMAGEIFHLLQVFGYIHSVWPRKIERHFDAKFTPAVAIFITVCGEPKDILAETVRAAKALDYPNFNIYILNDGYVAKRPNWREAEEVAKEYGAVCFTRRKPGGAKAGNINYALKKTKEPFFVVFDTDHIPKRHFLRRMMGYFADEKMGFVQSPQYYKNHALNQTTAGAWEQQALFFGAICKGKDAADSAFMCGTNMILRRTAIKQAGGMNEESIAEDFLTSLYVHKNGWKSVYVDEVLAEGLAPEDFLSYYKQQFRWARGSLEVIFKHNPLFMRGLSFNQRFQYLSSASFYLSGVFVAINAFLPLIFFYTGLEPLKISTMTLALVFIPYIFIVLYTLQLTSNYAYTFRAISFSLGAFPIHLKAILQILTGKKSGFVVTSKTQAKGNHIHLARPHIAYIVLIVIGAVIAIMRDGLAASVISNLAWGVIYTALFIPFIAAAAEVNKPEADAAAQPEPEPAKSLEKLTAIEEQA